jgi:outer membrane receptor for ferrienterochelin and colicins
MRLRIVRRELARGRCTLRDTLALLGIPLALALLLPAAARAQAGSVAGKVADATTGEPVVGVEVQLVRGVARVVHSTSTNEAGEFRIVGVVPGSYSLVFSRIGYQTKRVDDIAVGSEPLAVGTIALVSRAEALNPIIVTASRREEKALDAPAHVEVIARDEVEQRPSTTPVDHVREVPGVDMFTNGIAQHAVVARGFNNVFSGALFVLTDNRWASVPSLRFNAYNLIPTTNDDIERIEFVLGPGSALYGPNADKGVMHILTRSPLSLAAQRVPGRNYTQETTVSVTGGEREVAQVTARHAGLFGENVGYKISGSYLRGRDWPFTDPVEAQAAQVAGACLNNPVPSNPACAPFLPGPGQNPDVAQLRRIGARDFDAERFGGEARVDVRWGEGTTLVLNGGFTQLVNSVEMTGIGAAQGRDWRYTFAQARFRYGELFAQSYINFSDAGDTYLLRDGAKIEDNSFLYVGQVQHGVQVSDRQRFVYGADLIRTIPRTNGTINGQNEENDDITEIGGYVQSETRLSPQFDFVAALRLDHHSVIDDVVWSPRAALVYKPAVGHNLRLTYNRAFSQPTTNNLFLDIRSVADLGGLPYDVRAMGVFRKDGFTFPRDGTGRPLMHSPFTPPALGGPAQPLPLDATLFWDAAVAIFCAAQPGVCQATNLQSVPPPTAAQVGTVMRALDPATRSFVTVPDVNDIPGLKSNITNTVELGYKGFIADRLSLAVDVYYSRLQDFVGPLFVETPNVFLDRTTLAQYFVTQGYDPATAGLLAAGMAGVDGNPQLPGIPLGTVTPEGVPGDPFDIYLTYRNFGEVDLWGADLGAKFLATDRLSFAGTYSFVNRNFLEDVEGITDLALNAPRNKATLSSLFDDPTLGLRVELRGRYVEGFRVLSGVYQGRVDTYTLVDANLHYALPFSRSTQLSITAQNLLDLSPGHKVFNDRHREMVGAPEIGRLVLVRLRQTF